MSDNTKLICGECGEELALRVLARWPNGDVQEAEWTCGHDGHRKGRGWYCDGGTLDLGLVTDELLAARNDFEVFP